MNVTCRIPGPLLERIRDDLTRPHLVAFERAGFLTCGATWVERAHQRELLLTTRSYLSLADDHYAASEHVGAEINSAGMRHGVQAAYRQRAGLFHIHLHAHHGMTRFSLADLRSSWRYAPSFFTLVPHMPHGAIVLSHDRALGLVWLAPRERPVVIERFVAVDAPLTRCGRLQ